MTHRQFLAWQNWLDRQQDEPSRSDWYSMQVAMLTHNANSKDKRSLADMRLKFANKPKQLTRKQRTTQMKQSQQYWIGAVGAKVRERN